MKRFLIISLPLAAVLFIGHILLSIFSWIDAGTMYGVFGSSLFLHYFYLFSGPTLWLVVTVLVAIAIFRIKSKKWFKWVLLVIPIAILLSGCVYSMLEVVISITKYKKYTEGPIVYNCDTRKGAYIRSIVLRDSASSPGFLIVKKQNLFLLIAQFISEDQLKSLQVTDDLGGSSSVRTEDGLLFIPAGKTQTAEKPAVASRENEFEYAWKNIEKAIQSGKTQRNESGGYQDLGKRLFSLVSFSKLQELSGTKIYLKGPHSLTDLNYSSTTDFGHYNPEFVRWMVKNLIPGKENNDLRDATQSLYRRYLRPLARGFYIVHYKLNEQKSCMELEKSEYLRKIEAKELTTNSEDFTRYQDFLKKGFCADSSDNDYTYLDIGLDPAVYSSIVTFWLRRSIDGTINEFADGLTQLLTVYDEEFLIGLGRKDNSGSEKPASAGDMTDE